MFEQEFIEGQVIADAFCGVGAIIVTAAKKLGCNVIANDLNPDAVKYAEANAERNLIPNEKFHVECGDARDFIRSLGTKGKTLPDHLILNYPLDSCSFLDQLRWWPSNGNVETMVHVYTFARPGSKTDRSQEAVAIDMVADNLLPEGGYSEKTINRRNELDELGCMVRVHEVCDVALGKAVVCVLMRSWRKAVFVLSRVCC
uniref:SAM-dependent methyltransferase TRM5/TYW2-type domain-containing protein n=1 Tax=Leptocylindrus danicus TaxID=163516 RepID=A0A7S2JXL7_9STRA|mmetsp:Transcript_13840/g.20522  ORF Transcript_13840/g.20522 Transcript_13840/m.20522 type:complete len:201 (+) Transcript_13840:345-947(+)